MADDYNIDQLSEEDKALLIKEYGEEIASRLMANTVDEKDKEEFTALEQQSGLQFWIRETYKDSFTFTGG